ncbi:hypothetical protein EYF80_004031 [Liparis tanakae]|uniref:Uncharacterized protein n=1 Tax=Liparis tanakae TaxID=230148 RepID=A0A4Z2J797_9TELE|nr:hypothetical protein EYF80_004031 [Liparis tanakae]
MERRRPGVVASNSSGDKRASARLLCFAYVDLQAYALIGHTPRSETPMVVQQVHHMINREGGREGGMREEEAKEEEGYRFVEQLDADAEEFLEGAIVGTEQKKIISHSWLRLTQLAHFQDLTEHLGQLDAAAAKRTLVESEHLQDVQLVGHLIVDGCGAPDHVLHRVKGEQRGKRKEGEVWDELPDGDLLRHLVVKILTVEHHGLQDGQGPLQHRRVHGRLVHATEKVSQETMPWSISSTKAVRVKDSRSPKLRDNTDTDAHRPADGWKQRVAAKPRWLGT